MLSHARTPVPVKAISHGQNAGRPRPITDICIDRLRAALDVACALRARGYVVMDAQVMDGRMPIVMVEAGRRTAEMIEVRHACYVADGRDQVGAYRIGQFEIDGVAVQWEERGGH